MKDKVEPKQAKKAARKQNKKEMVAKSLTDIIKKTSPGSSAANATDKQQKWKSKSDFGGKFSANKNSNFKGKGGNNSFSNGKGNFQSKNKPPYQQSHSQSQWKGKPAGVKPSFDKSNRPPQYSLQSKQQYAKELRTSKPHFQLVEGLKSYWNRIRDRSTAAEQRVEILDKLVASIDGHVLQVALRHDASRIVQTILQFGSTAQREKMLDALQMKLADVSKTPYGHFVVLKAINYCVRAVDQRKIATGLRGHFVALGCNVIGARIVESVLQLYPTAVSKPLRAEFYGQKFCVMVPEAPKNLSVLMRALPDKQSAILDHMRDLVQRFVQKGLLEFAFVHHLLWEYTQEVLLLQQQQQLTAVGADDAVAVDGSSSSSRMQDLVNTLCESAPKLMSTKPGVKIMCAVITQAAAKERKRIIKTLKGHALESVLHDSAFLGIMRIVDVTDDSVNVQKSLLDELKSLRSETKYSAAGEVLTASEPPMLAVAKHRTGHKLLLRLLSPQLRHLEPDEEQLFSQPSLTSKKSAEVRRREHLVYLRSSLLHICSRYTEDLMRSRHGSKVLEGVVRVFRPARVLKNIAVLLTGGELIDDGIVADEDEDEEGGSDDEELDVDADEDVDEDAAADDDVDAVAETEEEDAAEEGDEEIDPEFESDMQTSFAEDAVAAPAKKSTVAAAAAEEAAAAVLLPIDEDPVVHVLIRRLLQYESFLQTQHCAVGTVALRKLLRSEEYSSIARDEKHVLCENEKADPTLWIEDSNSSNKDSSGEDSVEASATLAGSKKRSLPTATAAVAGGDNTAAFEQFNGSSLADEILQLLLSSDSNSSGSSTDKTKLSVWLTKNRPCFVLVKLFSVPSCAEQLAHIMKQPTAIELMLQLQQQETNAGANSSKKAKKKSSTAAATTETHLSVLEDLVATTAVQGARVLLQLYETVSKSLKPSK